MTVFGNSVNYIDLMMLGIIIIAALLGWVRGIAVSIINFIRTAVGMFLCFYLANNGSRPLYEAAVKPRLLEYINQKIVTSGNIDEVLGNLNEFTTSFPEFISDALNIKSLNISSTDMADAILTNVFEPIALFLTKVCIFIAVFIIFFGATAIIMHLVSKAKKKKNEKRGRESVLKKTDRLLGVLFGILKAGILVLAFTSVLMYILSLKEELPSDSTFWLQVENSKIIQFINTINPFNAITEGLI